MKNKTKDWIMDKIECYVTPFLALGGSLFLGSCLMGIVSSCLDREVLEPIPLTRYEINGPKGLYHRASFDFNNDGWLTGSELRCLEDCYKGNYYSEHCGHIEPNYSLTEKD